MSTVNRRDFIKLGAASAATLSLAGQFTTAFAAGSDKLRVGQIGCGGRGQHDAGCTLAASKNIELVALGDLFEDRLKGHLNALKSGEQGSKVNVPADKQFVGWDAYKKVLACDIDLVLLTQTPHFRPMHLRAAVEAGKHVFMEKPIAVDPVGVRHVIESSDMAEKKGLTILAGTQMRRIPHLVDGVKRLQEGAIGKIVSGQCVRMGDALMQWGAMKRKPEWSDMEWHIRRWLFLTWLSGDFIVEQHVHNLDIVNWVMGGHPVKCVGIGGRDNRTDEIYGDAYDHFAAEYEYANGVKIAYIGAQMDGITDRCDQTFQGDKGSAYNDFAVSRINGQQYDGPAYDPDVRGHADQEDAIRTGKKLNEGRQIAESTMTAIMGRMSAYTGRALKWDWVMNASKLDLSPAKYEFGPLPWPKPPVPCKTPLV